MLVYNSSWKFGYVFFQLGQLKWDSDWVLEEGDFPSWGSPADFKQRNRSQCLGSLMSQV